MSDKDIPLQAHEHQDEQILSVEPLKDPLMDLPNSLPPPAVEEVLTIAGPGAMLAAQREALGLSIEQVATQLNLAIRQIQALETDHFSALPGVAIVRGFIRSYAKLLGLDPAPLLDMLGQNATSSLIEPLTMRPALSAPFFDDSRMSVMGMQGPMHKTNFLLPGLIILVLGLFGGYQLGWLPQLPNLLAQKPDAEVINVPVSGTLPLNATPASESPVEPSLIPMPAGALPLPAAAVTVPESKKADALPSTPPASNVKSETPPATAVVNKPVAPLVAPEVNKLIASVSTSLAAPLPVPASVPVAAKPTGAGVQSPAPVSVKPAAPATSVATLPVLPSPTKSVPETVRSAPVIPAKSAPVAPLALTPPVVTASSVAIKGKDALLMKVRDDTWIEIRRTGAKENETPLVSRVLKAGSTERFDVPEAVVLTIGNVNGVEANLRGIALDTKSTAKGNVVRLNIN